MTSTLDIRRPSAHVAEVWLNRPDVRNAFNDGVIRELTDTFRMLSADEALRVVVLGGRGGAGLGLLPATIGPYVVRALGEQASRRYFVTAERFIAVQALSLGFVHAVCTLDEIDAKV